MQNGRDLLCIRAHAGDVRSGRKGANQKATRRGKACELRVEVVQVDATARVLANAHLRAMSMFDRVLYEQRCCV
jgi:hypothetical protein